MRRKQNLNNDTTITIKQYATDRGIPILPINVPDDEIDVVNVIATIINHENHALVAEVTKANIDLEQTIRMLFVPPDMQLEEFTINTPIEYATFKQNIDCICKTIAQSIQHDAFQQIFSQNTFHCFANGYERTLDIVAMDDDGTPIFRCPLCNVSMQHIKQFGQISNDGNCPLCHDTKFVKFIPVKAIFEK